MTWRDRALQRQEANEALDAYYSRHINRARDEAAASTAPEPDEPVEVDEATRAAGRAWWAQHCQPITDEWLASILARH